jgi:tRNA G18 (ribose-2'-O)-methylase SpoU
MSRCGRVRTPNSRSHNNPKSDIESRGREQYRVTALPADRLTPIADPADPRVREYLGLKERDLFRGLDARSPHGTFICEGHFVVEHLIDAHDQCRSILVAASKADTYAALLARVPLGVPIYTVGEGIMESIVGFKFHRGILAAGSRSAPLTAAQADALIAAAPALVVLEDLTNIDNVGGIFRCASALAPQGTVIVLSPQCADPLYRKSIRVSMGHALRVPFVTLTPWDTALARIHAAGFDTLALTPDPTATPLRDVRIAPPRRIALLLGSEGPGLGSDTMAHATHRVRIPQRPGVDSLNVMVAAAIAMAQSFQ